MLTRGAPGRAEAMCGRLRRLVDRAGGQQDDRHDRDDDESDPWHPAHHVQAGPRMRRMRVGEVSPQLRGAL